MTIARPGASMAVSLIKNETINQFYPTLLDTDSLSPKRKRRRRRRRRKNKNEKNKKNKKNIIYLAYRF